MQQLLSQVWYMYGIPMIRSKMIEYDNLNVVWRYGSCLKSLCLSFLFCLKACLALSLLSSFDGHLCKTSRTKLAIVYMLWQPCETRDGTKICTKMIWYACNGSYDHWCAQVTLPAILKWLVSIGKVHKMVYRFINAMARSTQRCHRTYRPCLRSRVTRLWGGRCQGRRWVAVMSLSNCL